MKVNKKHFSHIRKKVPFTGEVASMTLDMYYKKHVQQPRGTEAQKRNTQPSRWLRSFKRTHYFGHGYLPRQPLALLEQRDRMKKFQRNIREVKGMIDFKTQMDTQQRMLEQLKIDIAQKEEAAGADRNAEITSPEDPRQPLVVMIDDEVLYDEEYKFDPLWKLD